MNVFKATLFVGTMIAGIMTLNGDEIRRLDFTICWLMLLGQLFMDVEE